MSRCTGGLGLPCGCDVCRGIEPKVAHTATGHALDAIAETPRPVGTRSTPLARASRPRCHFGPREGWCDRDGPGEFIGHTCDAPAKSPNLYGLITPPFNEAAERVAFCDWYRNTYSYSAEGYHGGWNGRDPATAWSAWLARAKR